MHQVWRNRIGVLDYDEIKNFKSDFGDARTWVKTLSKRNHENEVHKVVTELNNAHIYATTRTIRAYLWRELSYRQTTPLRFGATVKGALGVSKDELKLGSPPLLIVCTDSTGSWTIDDMQKRFGVGGSEWLRLYILLDVAKFKAKWRDKHDSVVDLTEDQGRTIILWHELGHVKQLLEDPDKYYKWNLAPGGDYLADEDNMKRHERPLCRDMGVDRRWIYESMGTTTARPYGDYSAQKLLKKQRQAKL